MTICKTCGVEYGKNYPACPLCEMEEPNDKWSPVYNYNQPAKVVEKYKSEIRNQMWEMTAIIALLVIAFFIVLDLAYNGKIEWSIYPVASVAATWLIFTSFVKLASRPYLTITSVFTILLALTATIDLADGSISWFIKLAMPVCLATGLLVLLIVVMTKRSKHKGFNVLGMIVTAISILSVVIELFVKISGSNRVEIRWSLIVSTALIPVAGVLFFIHYRMQRGKQLDSYFHV